MITVRRGIQTMACTVAAMLLAAGPALAHDCTNASKPAGAGAQVLFGGDDGSEILWATRGVRNRIEKGLIDPETGEGFHGLIAFDLDGDGEADASLYDGVGPDGAIPSTAQEAGKACKGVTNIDVYLEECVDA